MLDPECWKGDDMERLASAHPGEVLAPAACALCSAALMGYHAGDARPSCRRAGSHTPVAWCRDQV